MADALTLKHILALPYVSAADWKLLPQKPGLYCVIADRAQVLYVGMTAQSIRFRWSAHHRRRTVSEFPEITIAYLEGIDLSEIERATIAARMPPLNVRDVPMATRRCRTKPNLSTTSGGLIKGGTQLTPEQYAWLKAQAAARGLTSVAAVLRVMVQAAMAAERRDGAPKESAA